MSRRRIVVTGAAGMVGSYVPTVFTDDELVLTGRQGAEVVLDVRDPEAVRRVIGQARPEVVLHLAAATDVDRCEQDPDWAYHCNALGTQNVATACLESGAQLVYLSTAGVFWGDKPDPYTEFDVPRPANIYGRSKLAGEQIVASLLPRAYIVRAGWMVGGGDKDKKFVGKIARLISEGRNPLRVVNDKWGSPTYAKDLLEGVRQLLTTGYYGLYHMANPGCCSRYEVALLIRDALQRSEVNVIPIPSDQFPLPAPRARSEAMRNLKLELLGLYRMRPWQEAVQAYVAEELVPKALAPAGGPHG